MNIGEDNGPNQGPCKHDACPLAESVEPPVEQFALDARNAWPNPSLFDFLREFAGMAKDKESIPPPVLSDDPDAELEKRLRRNPGDDDAKADVGSDESMDASDPPSATQPGQTDEPVPSSGFPE